MTGGTAFGRVFARWGFFIIGIGIAVIMLWMYHAGSFLAIPRPGTTSPDAAWTFRNALTVLVMLEVGIIAMVAIYMSAGAVSREREDGTLDLILTTPVTPKYYIWGKLRGLVSFLMILIAVPVITVGIVAAYVQFGYIAGYEEKATIDVINVFDVNDDFIYRGTTGPPSQTGVATNAKPLLLPEAVILLPAMLIPFIAVCVVIGLRFSLHNKTVIAAVVWTVLSAGGWAGFWAFCGYYSAMEIPVIGPILNAFSPTTNVLMILNPWDHVDSFVDSRNNTGFGRISLLFAALIAIAAYAAVIWSVVASMTSSFDHTVRKLSGTAG